MPWEVQDRGLDDAAFLELGRQVLADCVASPRDEGIDLAQYNSVRIAADVDAARQALGYERIVFYGASYGAQLDQHFMRDFPDSLESVVLDGANSLSRGSWVEERARDVDVATRKLAALREAESSRRPGSSLSLHLAWKTAYSGFARSSRTKDSMPMQN